MAHRYSGPACVAGLIPRHGVIADQGTAFTSDPVASELRTLCIRHVLATTERPQTNELAEYTNRNLVSTMKAYIKTQQDDWDDHLPATLSINSSTRQSSTRSTPFELVYGGVAVLPHQLSFSWPSPPVDSHRELL